MKTTKKILFISDENGFSAENPFCDLVKLSRGIETRFLKELESNQQGVFRRGGVWREIMIDGSIDFQLLKSGRKSDFFCQIKNINLFQEIIKPNKCKDLSITLYSQKCL